MMRRMFFLVLFAWATLWSTYAAASEAIALSDGGVLDDAGSATEAAPANEVAVDSGSPVIEDEGTSGPPTAAGTTGHGFRVRPGLEVFAQYTYRNARAEDGGRSWYHEFDLPRVHGSLDAEVEQVRARVLIEGVRSAGAGSLVGVATNSFVLRVREAYAAYRPVPLLEVYGGMVPTFTVPEFDGTSRLRPVAISALEGYAISSPADLGAGARITFPKKYGFVGVGLYNGEGYASPDLNRGKSLEGAVEVHPLPNGPLLPLGLFASYVSGSVGAERSRADRATLLFVWQGKRLRAGLGGTYAWGIASNGIQEAVLLDAFVRAEPLARVLLGARATHFVRDTSVSPLDAVTNLTGTVGYRVADPMESFLAVSKQAPTDFARGILPGSDAWEVRAVTRIAF